MKECPHGVRELWHLMGMGEKELKVNLLGKGVMFQPFFKGVRLKALRWRRRGAYWRLKWHRASTLIVGGC